MRLATTSDLHQIDWKMIQFIAEESKRNKELQYVHLTKKDNETVRVKVLDLTNYYNSVRDYV